MKHFIRIGLFLLTFFIVSNCNAQFYQGKAVQVVDSLLNDTSYLKRVHLVLTLESRDEGGKYEQKMEYKRFDALWNLKNEAYFIVSDSRYSLVIDDQEQVIFLTEEDAQKPWAINEGSLNAAEWVGAIGNTVKFRIKIDTGFAGSLEYAVDTFHNKLLNVTRYYDNLKESGFISQSIIYEVIEPLVDVALLTKVSSIAQIKKRKAVLLPPYTNYLFFDNRKEP